MIDWFYDHPIYLIPVFFLSIYLLLAFAGWDSKRRNK